jgi:hypothetical protein
MTNRVRSDRDIALDALAERDKAREELAACEALVSPQRGHLLEYQRKLLREKRTIEAERDQFRKLYGLALNDASKAAELRAERDELVKAGQLVYDDLARMQAERDRLYNALVEARPYIFNRTQGDDWRAETARDVLMRIDAALAANKEGTVI